MISNENTTQSTNKQTMSGAKSSSNKRILQVIFIPLVTSIIPICTRNEIGSSSFVLIVMSLYWIIQCVPIATTSLMPIFLFPLFGIMSSKEITPIYFNDNIMFIFGSLMIGICIETSGLHQKLALSVCMIVGSEPKWILLGIMSTTAFLSIWVANAAVASMMLPIVTSLARNLIKLDPAFSDQPIEEKKNRDEELDEDDIIFEKKAADDLINGFYISVTASSLIGGTASLIGTGSNVFLKGYFQDIHPDSSLNFLSFLLFALPFSVLHLLGAWLVFGYLFLPTEKFIDFKRLFSTNKTPTLKIHKTDVFRDLVRKKYDQLGPYTWEQKSISVFFLTAVVLWLTRDLYFVPGWSVLFVKSYVTDASVAIVILVCVISWPRTNPLAGKAYEPLLSWSNAEKMFQWNVILLVGGSLAMAEGCSKSGLSKWLGHLLKEILPDDQYLSLLSIMMCSVVGTEFMSNMSMISLLLPILDDIAQESGINYYFYLLPQAIAVNLSFMFPSACASNAIIFGTGRVKLKNMILSGLIIKLMGCVILMFVSSTWLSVLFYEDYSTTARFVANATLNTTSEFHPN